MKAIVANVLFGSILGCLSWTNSAWANPLIPRPSQSYESSSPMLSAQKFSSARLPVAPQIFNLVDRFFTVNQSGNFNLSIDREAEIIFADRFGLQLLDDRDLTLNQKPDAHQQTAADLILGFQKAFWSGQQSGKYWGFTTVEHWGDNNPAQQHLNLAKLNYTNLAPTLAVGSSRLTVSGGVDNNLIIQNNANNTSPEFEQFRGGVAYHHGVSQDITMGVGFVYQDLWVGFTQVTYDSDILPLKTTLSLLNQESGINFRSQVRLQPADNLVLNYYHDRHQDQLNVNWKLISGLTLTAARTEASDRQKDSYSAGVEVAIRNEYMSISAKALLNSDRNLQLNVKSQIGKLRFVHQSNEQKSISEINLDVIKSDAIGFKCSAYVNYQSKIVKQEREDFLIWGSKLQSTHKITPNQHKWSLNIGYGSGSYGRGLIASGALGLKPNLSLKLSYQQVSASSDEQKLKLELGTP